MGKLPEAKTKMGASEAAHKVMYPETELPVAWHYMYGAGVVLDGFASKYNNVATVEGANYLQLATDGCRWGAAKGQGSTGGRATAATAAAVGQ